MIESDQLVEQIQKFDSRLPDTLNKNNKVWSFILELREIFDRVVIFDQKNFLQELASIGFPNRDKVDVEVLRSIILKSIKKYREKVDFLDELSRSRLDIVEKIMIENDFSMMLDDNDEMVLIDKIVSEFIARIYFFLHSIIYIDEEESIKSEIIQFKKTESQHSNDSARPLNGFHKIDFTYVDSKLNFLIQISDIMIGLIKELYVFSSVFSGTHKEWGEYLCTLKTGMTELQLDTMFKICQLHDSSITYHPGMQSTITPVSHRERFDIMLKIFSV